MDALLELRNITKRYPGVVALDNVTMNFEKGLIHALMGENGAGKSTLIKVISGAITPSEGMICYDGHEYPFMTPALTNGLGIGVIYQEFNLVPSLTVAENVFLGKKTGGKIFPDFIEMETQTARLLEDLGVDIDVRTKVGELSVAKQQIVEIAKAVGRDVKLLIMDEPSAAIAQAEVDNLLRIVRNLKEKGVTIIYISHRMNEVFQIADTVSVLRDGKYIDAKPMHEVTRSDLIRMMVGRELSETYPRREVMVKETVLDVKNLYGNGNCDISFSLHRGEILGIAGLVGAGRTELAKVIVGAEPMTSGSLSVKGRVLKKHNVRKAISCGIGLIPEDRKREGCFLEYSILWNVSVMSLPRFSKYSFISQKSEERLSLDYIKRMRIKTPTYHQLVKNLSGGNQQKVVLAKVLAAQTDIIIFDEPTRGIDVGAKQEIYKLMNELAERGTAIIMISSDMEELMGMSDRILVMCEGRITGEVAKGSYDQAHILELASRME